MKVENSQITNYMLSLYPEFKNYDELEKFLIGNCSLSGDFLINEFRKECKEDDAENILKNECYEKTLSILKENNLRFSSYFAVFISEKYPEIYSAAARCGLTDDVESLVSDIICKMYSNLYNIGIRVLVFELEIAKEQGMLIGNTPEERFDFFSEKLLTDEQYISQLHNEYKLMYSIITKSVEQTADFVKDILANTSENIDEIKDKFFFGKDPGSLLYVNFSIGDAHKDGRSVTVLVFENGNVVYKPHSLESDQAFQTLIYIVFLVFGIIGAGAYIRSQTSNAEIAGMGTDYLRICCIFSFGMSFFAVYEKLLQSTGHSMYSTIAQIMGALTNIILDPILIYGWVGLPAMDVKGAAYATVIGQIVSFAAALTFHLKINTVIPNKLCYFKPSLNTIKDIYAIGLPAIISQALISVMTYGLNLIFGGISEIMVTAYGLYYKIQQFLLFAAFGMRDAIMPVTAFSFGMRDKKRVRNCVKYGHIYTAIIMIAGLAAIEIFAAPFSNVFGLSGETQSLFISAMRIISISFVFAGVNIAFQGMFQAMEGGVESLVISICRQIICIFPFALIFAEISKSDSAMTWVSWITFPIAETFTAVIAILLFRRIWGKIEKNSFKALDKKEEICYNNIVT